MPRGPGLNVVLSPCFLLSEAAPNHNVGRVRPDHSLPGISPAACETGYCFCAGRAAWRQMAWTLRLLSLLQWLRPLL